MQLPTLQNNLLGDVTKIAHDALVRTYSKDGKTGQYVSSHMVDVFREISDRARQRIQGQPGIANNGLQPITDEIAKLTPDDVNRLSRLAAVYSLVANAVGSAERAASFSDPKDQIKEFLYKRLSPDKNNPAQTVDDKVKLLRKTLDDLIISLVHTMHPTIYHTPEARQFEAKLIAILENKDNYQAVSLSSRRKLNAHGESEVKKRCEEFMEQLALGEAHISPKRPMTVSVETQMEKENLKRIHNELSLVVAAWNDAVKEFAAEGLTDAHRAQLKITPEHTQKIFEFRTWGQSADADGREKSTSQFLYECIQNNLETGGYEGATLDLRQNAKKVHIPLMDALVHVAYRNSHNERYGEGRRFADFCRQFLKEHPRYGITDPKNFRFTMMKGFDSAKPENLDDRLEFLSEIIRSDHELIPEQVGIDALAFNSGIDKTPRPDGLPYEKASPDEVKGKGVYALLTAFTNRYKKEIEQAGYDPKTIQYMEMGDITIPYDLNKSDGVKISMRGAWDAVVKLNGWQIQNNGLQYTRLFSPVSSEKPILDFWRFVNPDQIRVQNFLQGTDTLAKKEKQIDEIRNNGGKLDVKAHYKPVSLEDRATLTDTAKRLFVINDAIKKYGEKVATRYQIANFSEPADFMILLKLFQDTGVAEIKNGVVTKSKLAIQPLLETGEDLRNARNIFEKLLENPVARSFWEARNNEVEIMIGHSDGGASVGNFASEWAIYKAERELVKLFEDEKRWGHKFKVRFFHGRGRGVNRGGTIDPSLHAKLLPPEETQRGIYDVTIQSDLPTDLAASEAYGKDYFTKILLSTLDAAITAPQRKAEAESLTPLEKAIAEIADNSSKRYEEFVRLNPAARIFLNNASDNPYKTSRSTSRVKESDKKDETFDDIRAIPKEYLFNLIDLPVHNIGLRQAMDEYEAQPGRPALAELNKHPFFKSVMQMIGAGMTNYDRDVARAHAKITKSEDFVNKVAIPHLDRLSERLAKLTYDRDAARKKLEKNRSNVERINAERAENNEPPILNQVDFNPPSWSRILDQIGHGIIVVSGEKGNPAKPDPTKDDQTQWIDTLYNGLFINSEGIRNAKMPWRARETEWSLSAA